VSLSSGSPTIAPAGFSNPENASPPSVHREVRFDHSPNLISLLSQLGVSLLISTYQAGKLVAVGVRHGVLELSFHNFDRIMGIAAGPGRAAVGAKKEIWLLRNAADIAPRLDPAGTYDACFLARTAHHTGEIQVHEMAWAGGELWLVNTLFSCLCTLHDEYNFVPRWRPPFVTALAAEDRCHLNGVAIADGRPRYVTALAETDAPQGWRPNKATSGCVIDVATGAAVARGFSMPHSPRIYGGRLWLLDSGTGRLLLLDPATAVAQPVVEFPGYTRGLAFHESFAFVGLSKIRETAVFGGVPIAERREELRCGVAVVDLRSARAVAYLEFQSGVDEIFAVEVLPGIRCPAVSGPYADIDTGHPIWRVPDPGQRPPG
jgi:uncharacterized protein (TIGR03032 family)